jgi:DNA-binding NarL/FixJ family response regulator
VRKPRIIVADDNQPFLQKLTSTLVTEFDIVATAPDGEAALNLIRRHKPDAVVLDLAMPVFNGLEVIRKLKENADCPAVVICSVETDPEVIAATGRAGAVAYVLKSRVEKDIVLAVRCAVQDKSFVSPGITSRSDLPSTRPSPA